MGWILAFLLFSLPAEAGSASARLELSGYVPPMMRLAVRPFRDGLSLVNQGNEPAILQLVGDGGEAPLVARLTRGQELFLRPELMGSREGRGPVEIRIMAP